MLLSHARRRRWTTSPTAASTTWWSRSTRWTSTARSSSSAPTSASASKRSHQNPIPPFLFLLFISASDQFQCTDVAAFTVLRCLLPAQIDKYVMHISRSKDLMGRLSPQEQKYAERYLLHCHCFYYVLIIDGSDGN
jgi:hypothetical protein